MLKMLCLYLLGQKCLYFLFKPYLSSETYSRKYEKLLNIVIHAGKILQKKEYFWKYVARKLGFVYYVSPHCVETVKWLGYNRYFQLTRWCSGKASAMGARCPGFNSRLRNGFLCLNFVWFCCCVLLCVFIFCPKHIICHNILQFILHF